MRDPLLCQAPLSCKQAWTMARDRKLTLVVKEETENDAATNHCADTQPGTSVVCGRTCATITVTANNYCLKMKEMPKDSCVFSMLSSAEPLASAIAQLMEILKRPYIGAGSKWLYMTARHSRVAAALRSTTLSLRSVLVRHKAIELGMQSALQLCLPVLISSDELVLDAACPPRRATTADEVKSYINSALATGTDVFVRECSSDASTFVVFVHGDSSDPASLLTIVAEETQAKGDRTVLTTCSDAAMTALIRASAEKSFCCMRARGYGLLRLQYTKSTQAVQVCDVLAGGNLTAPESVYEKLFMLYGAPTELIDRIIEKAPVAVGLDNTRQDGAPKMEVITTDSSKGSYLCVASQDVYCNEIMSFLDLLPIIDTNSKYAVTRGFGKFFDTTDQPESRLNHSCSPNLYICFDDFTVRALTDIAKGTELTFNYFYSEYEMAAPFDCLCGSPACFGSIAGFVGLPEERRCQMLKDASPWVKSNLARVLNQHGN